MTTNTPPPSPHTHTTSTHTMSEAEVQELKSNLMTGRTKAAISPQEMLSSGSTLLNLACSGRPNSAFAKGKYYFFVGDSGSGKAQPLSAKILTPSGWKRMGEMKPGVKIIDPDGGVGTVLSVHPQGEVPVFRIRFSDNTHTFACGEHLWTVQTNNDRRRGRWQTLNTIEMQRRLHEHIYLPDVQPVQFEPTGEELPLQPYLLGALIGDGCFRGGSPTFSNPDKEVVDRCRQELPHGGEFSEVDGLDWRIVYGKNKKNLVKEALKELELWNCLSYQKFIPDRYIYAGVEQRLDLLRGLMDTDGYQAEHGNPSFATSSETLLKQIMFLVRSLGGAATRTKGKAAPKYTHNGEERIGRPSYAATLSLPQSTGVMFHLSRKRERAEKTNRLRPRCLISVTPAGTEESQCIRVDTKRNLYLTDGLIPTHNTFLALTCLAEAAKNPNFDEYELIHDNAEDGALMDMSYFFGEKAASRIRSPRQLNGQDKCSSTVEEFYFHLDIALKLGKPFIYILDSMDCLTSEDDLEKFDEVNKHRLKKEKAEANGKELKQEVAGSYGTAKAKANSSYLRVAVSEMQKTGSILIIISQTRDKIGSMPSFNTKTRSGGHALKFYATLEMWLSVKEEIKKRVKGRDRAIGVLSQVHLKKNRENGRNRKVLVPVYYDVGIDDVGSCVDYLVEEGHWKEGQTGINAAEFDFKGKRDEVIRHVEQNELEKELRRLVAGVWEEIEEACRVERKRRYE